MNVKVNINIGKKHRSFFRGFSRWVFLGVLLTVSWGSRGQQAVQRVYANTQMNNGCSGLLCTITVDNEGGAVDNILTTHSTLEITVVGNVWQKLNFPEQAPAGTPVRIKIGTSTDLVSLLGNIKVQAYMGNTTVGNDVVLSSLVSLLGGEDQGELVFTPMNGGSPVAYDAVRFKYTGIALGGGFRIYEAYFYKPMPGVIACNEAVDVLYGSTGNIAGGLNGVDNPYNAIDSNSTSAATIKATVSALNKTHLTALFPMASSTGDFVKIILEKPGTGLLDATIIANNFTIRTYLDNMDNGALALDPALLRLFLFPGSTKKQVLLYPINQPFNRIQVSMGEGLAVVLDELLVYEISRLSKGPDIIGTSPTGEIDFCEDETISLSIDNPESGSIYEWYSQASGGSVEHTGTSYNPVILLPGSYTYYVSATKSICTEESDKTKIELTVKPRLGHPDISISSTTD